jgi:hypothetical protein
VIEPRPYRPLFTAKVSAIVAITLVVVGGGWTRFEPLALFNHREAVADEQQAVAQTEFAPTAEPQFVTRPIDAEVRWTRTWVNVREDRTVDSPIVLVLNPGVPVEVGNRQGAWWEAHLNGKVVGYMSNAVLSSQEPETD